MKATKERLLEPTTWDGLGFVDGWQTLHGVQTVVEPATGATLGRVGMANAADVARATSLARRAQTDWAALPYERR
ncbi:MAG: aldehyde dehydrogenase family protein, partial [Candidatus Velthaea sp.]